MPLFGIGNEKAIANNKQLMKLLPPTCTPKNYLSIYFIGP